MAAKHPGSALITAGQAGSGTHGPKRQLQPQFELDLELKLELDPEAEFEPAPAAT